MTDLVLDRPFEARLEARNLTLARGGAALLEHLDLAIGRGALVGAVGIGDALPALVEHARGAVDPWPGRRLGPPLVARTGALWLCGAQARDLTPARRARRGVGMMDGSSGPPLGATCLDHVAYACACAVAWRAPRAQCGELARVLLDRVGLGAAAMRSPLDLDPVQAAALHLASALAAGSRLLILAWPFRFLAPEARRVFAPIVERIALRDAAILVIDDDLSTLARMCPRLAVFWRTRLLADGSPGEVLRKPAVIQAFSAARPA